MKKLLISKRIIIIAVLLLAMAGMAKAQTHEFAPVGAEWYYQRLYREGWNFTGVTYDRFRSLRTLEINGWECKEIELYQHLDEYGVENPHTELYYITQEGNQIYEVTDEERYLLYDFDKVPGESWYAPKYNLTIYVIDTTSMILGDGSNRKVLHTFLQGDYDDYWYFDNIIEGIGLDQSIFPFLEFDGPPQSIHDYMRCYSENGIPLIISEMECEYEVLGADEHNDLPRISMNTMIDGMLHIKFSEIAESVKYIRIHDMTGEVVYMDETMDNMLDIDFSDMSVGVYLVQTIIGSQVINNKIVKK